MLTTKNRLTWLLPLFVLMVVFIGCPQPRPLPDEPAEVEAIRPTPLTLLVIDDDQLGNIIARQWSARRDGELTIVNQTSAEIEEHDYGWDPQVDVVLYPTGMLGELESRDRLLKIPRSMWLSDELNKNEFLKLHRSTLVRHGSEVWAVSLGGPQLSIMFNRNFFAERKQAIPNDWARMVELAVSLGSAAAPTDQATHPVSTKFELPLAEGWAVQVFLARVAPAIRNRGKLSTVFDRDTMNPTITDVPFVQALEDLKTIVGEDQSQLSLTPQQVFQRIISGKTAIGVTWPSHLFNERETEPPTSFELEFALLPGTDQWYDSSSQIWNQRATGEQHQVDLIGVSGLLGSVSSSSRNTETGFDFLQWLASKSITLVTVVQSPSSGPFRASHLGDPARWTGTSISDPAALSYATVVQAVNDQNVVLMFPRIPGRRLYLDSLDRNVRRCLRGDVDADAALQQVAQEWDVITDGLGREKQIAELRKDAGL